MGWLPGLQALGLRGTPNEVMRESSYSCDSRERTAGGRARIAPWCFSQKDQKSSPEICYESVTP